MVAARQGGPMNKHRLAAVLAMLVAGGAAAAADNWPSFRGPGGSGVAEGAPPPTSWSVPDNKNVKWRVPVAGLSHSSPVVWGNQVCVASAVSEGAAAALK